MVLLRKVIGDALRARRLAQHRTLRDVSSAANVSLGYLSEIERGHKEASSELLASICDALGARVSEMLTDVSATFALAEQMDEAFGEGPEAASVAASPSDRGPRAGAARAAPPMPTAVPATVPATEDGQPAGAVPAVTDGEITVRVHADSPLRARLTAVRTPPGRRRTESLLVG